MKILLREACFPAKSDSKKKKKRCRCEGGGGGGRRSEVEKANYVPVRSKAAGHKNWWYYISRLRDANVIAYCIRMVG